MWTPLTLGTGRSSGAGSSMLTMLGLSVPPAEVWPEDTDALYSAIHAALDLSSAPVQGMIVPYRKVTQAPKADASAPDEYEARLPWIYLRHFTKVTDTDILFQSGTVVEDYSQASTLPCLLVFPVPVDDVDLCRSQTECLGCPRSIGCHTLGYNRVAAVPLVLDPTDMSKQAGKALTPGAAVFDIRFEVLAPSITTVAGPHWSIPQTHHMLRPDKDNI